MGATATHPNERTDFKTDSGRPVPGGGGIVPDVEVAPESFTQFRSILEQSGSFTSFAAEFIHENKIAEGWDVSPQVLDQFKEWLSERRIQPQLAEWIESRDFIQSRLKTEIYNLTLGVEKGDEIEAQSDPQIQKAVEAVLKPAV